MLRIRMPFTTLLPNQTLTVSNTDQLITFNLSNPLVSSFFTTIRCLRLAEVDGVPVAVLNISAVNHGNGSGFIDLLFPSFSSTLFYDPDMSVLFGSSAGSTGGVVSGGGGGNNDGVIIGLAVGLGVGIPLIALIVFMIILVVLIVVARRRRKNYPTKAEDMVSF